MFKKLSFPGSKARQFENNFDDLRLIQNDDDEGELDQVITPEKYIVKTLASKRNSVKLAPLVDRKDEKGIQPEAIAMDNASSEKKTDDLIQESKTVRFQESKVPEQYEVEVVYDEEKDYYQRPDENPMGDKEYATYSEYQYSQENYSDHYENTEIPQIDTTTPLKNMDRENSVQTPTPSKPKTPGSGISGLVSPTPDGRFKSSRFLPAKNKKLTALSPFKEQTMAARSPLTNLDYNSRLATGSQDAEYHDDDSHFELVDELFSKIRHNRMEIVKEKWARSECNPSMVVCNFIN